MSTKPRARRGLRGERPEAGGRAPRIPVDQLTPAQERALTAHLKLKLPAPDAARLFAAIQHWFAAGGFGANAEAREWSAGHRRHMAQIATLARALQDALRVEPPLWNTAGIDWPTFDALLERVSCSAEASSPAPERLTGAPRVRWRDDLIAVVHAHYPPDKLTVSWCSHFETTLEMLLGYLGEELEDLHTQVRRTLKRGAKPPFTLRLE